MTDKCLYLYVSEKYRKQQGGKHFDASKCEGWEKKKKKLTPKAQRGREAADNLCFAATHPSVSIFPTGYIPTHSPTSPTSTLRAARAHDADLQICRSVPP